MQRFLCVGLSAAPFPVTQPCALARRPPLSPWGGWEAPQRQVVSGWPVPWGPGPPAPQGGGRRVHTAGQVPFGAVTGHCKHSDLEGHRFTALGVCGSGVQQESRWAEIKAGWLLGRPRRGSASRAVVSLRAIAGSSPPLESPAGAPASGLSSPGVHPAQGPCAEACPPG